MEVKMKTKKDILKILKENEYGWCEKELEWNIWHTII